MIYSKYGKDREESHLIRIDFSSGENAKRVLLQNGGYWNACVRKRTLINSTVCHAGDDHVHNGSMIKYKFIQNVMFFFIMFWILLVFLYEEKAYKIKFCFGVCMRFRIHRYVAAPCEGWVSCEEIDIHEYNFSPKFSKFHSFYNFGSNMWRIHNS